MNSSLNMLIKLLIFIIILLIGFVALFFAKVVDFDNLKKEEPQENVKKSVSEDPSEDKIKKINDSLNQREERIKALKEVGKKLGG